jgi:hypothetical protein
MLQRKPPHGRSRVARDQSSLEGIVEAANEDAEGVGGESPEVHANPAEQLGTRLTLCMEAVA